MESHKTTLAGIHTYSWEKIKKYKNKRNHNLGNVYAMKNVYTVIYIPVLNVCVYKRKAINDISKKTKDRSIP